MSSAAPKLLILVLANGGEIGSGKIVIGRKKRSLPQANSSQRLLSDLLSKKTMYRTSKIAEKQIEISRQLAILLRNSLITCEIYRSIDEHFVEIRNDNMETSSQILKLMLELRETGVILKQLDEYKKEFNNKREMYIGMVGAVYPSIAYETLKEMKANYIEMGGDELDLPALSPPNNYGRAPIS
jgi:hypothetical protein